MNSNPNLPRGEVRVNRPLGCLALALLAFLASPLQAQLPKCSQDHPSREHRLESVTKQGDARMTKSVAGHVTKYAMQRFNLQGLVTQADINRAQEATYEFLKWKLGNASAVAGQFVTAGYEHFDKAYVDEAAAALLGFELPKEKSGHSMFWLPPQFVDMKLMVDKTIGAKIGAYWLQVYGIPSEVSEPILIAIAEQEAKIDKRLGFNLPQKYDFPNGLVKLAIDAKRDPQGTRAKLQRAIDQAAAKQKAGQPAGQTKLPGQLPKVKKPGS